MSAPPKHRDAIVAAAATLFRRRGYAATGVNEIAELSGAPKGSLYHYFPRGKDEIGEAAVHFAAARVTATLEELFRTTSSAPALIRAYCTRLAGWMAKSGFRDGCPIATTLLEAAPQSEGVTDAGREAFAQWSRVIARALARDGFAKGEAEQFALLAIAAIEGALILARVSRSAEPIRRVGKALARAMRREANSEGGRSCGV